MRRATAPSLFTFSSANAELMPGFGLAKLCPEVELSHHQSSACEGSGNLAALSEFLFSFFFFSPRTSVLECRSTCAGCISSSVQAEKYLYFTIDFVDFKTWPLNKRGSEVNVVLVFFSIFFFLSALFQSSIAFNSCGYKCQCVEPAERLPGSLCSQEQGGLQGSCIVVLFFFSASNGAEKTFSETDNDLNKTTR